MIVISQSRFLTQGRSDGDQVAVGIYDAKGKRGGNVSTQRTQRNTEEHRGTLLQEFDGLIWGFVSELPLASNAPFAFIF